MNNPCLVLNQTQNGISIEKNAETLSILVSHELAGPIMLPEAESLNIRLMSNTSAHFFASDAQVNLILEPKAQAYWYNLSNNVNLSAQVKAEANLFIAQINLASQKSLCSMNIDLLAPEAQIAFVGLDLLKNSQESLVKLNINHKTSYTKSSQAFRGIYAGQSQGTFDAKISVATNACNSSAKQLYKSVILGKNARAHVRPQLEINNFNITASHGASIGQLDKEALFYLCSRGLSLESAQKVLVKSLAKDILQEIHPAMREYLSEEVELSLGALHEC